MDEPGSALVSSILEKAGLSSYAETLRSAGIDDHSIFHAPHKGICFLLAGLNMNAGEQLSFIKELSIAEKKEEYLAMPGSTAITIEMMKEWIGDERADTTYETLVAEELTTVASLRRLTSSQWERLPTSLDVESMLTTQIWKPIVIHSSSRSVSPVNITVADVDISPSEKKKKTMKQRLRRRSVTDMAKISGSLKKRSNTTAKRTRSPTAPPIKSAPVSSCTSSSTPPSKASSSLKRSTKSINGLPFVDAGAPLVSGTLGQEGSDDRAWNDAAKVHKKQLKKFASLSSSSALRLTACHERTVEGAPDSAQGVPSKVFGIHCGPLSNIVMAWSEVLVSCADTLPPIITGNASNTLGGGKWYGIDLGDHVSSVACSDRHMLVSTESGKLYGWGSNYISDRYTNYGITYGLLGHDESTSELERTDLSHLVEGEVQCVACGSLISAVLTSVGAGLFTCGIAETNALARNGSAYSFQPILYEDRITKVACGETHLLALTSRGEVLACGHGSQGQLGLGKNRTVQTTLKGIPSICDIQNITCGSEHSIAIDINGVPYVWGSNKFGQLAVPFKRDCEYTPVTPTQPQQDVRFKFISAGTHSSLFISVLGLVFVSGKVWGYASKGMDYMQVVESLYRNLSWISQGALGDTNKLFLKDDWMTELLETCIQYSHPDADIQINFLKNMYVRIPKNMIKRVQERVSMHLNETREYTEMNIDIAYIEFNPKEKTKNSTKVFRVSNPCNQRISVDVVMDQRELEANSRYSFEFEPASFTLEKKQIQIVKVRLLCNRVATESATFLFSVTGTTPKKKLLPNLQFMVAQIEPLSGVKVAKVADESLVKTMSSYVPQYILKDVKASWTPRIESTIAQFPACILFIDVSALNERLAKLGPAGPEQVSRHLNAYFGQLIDAVNNFGGDVLKFAGDALICMFGDDRKAVSTEDLVLKATQCALFIQSDLARYDSNQGFVLTLHVGIGVGDMYSLYVGGVDGCWEWLVVGEPFLQLKTSVDLSKTGEVVVSPQCWDLIKDKCNGEPREGDWLVTEVTSPVDVVAVEEFVVPPTAAAHLRGYIQKGVQARLDAHQAQWIAELRRITVLFIKLNSLTYNPDEPFDSDTVNGVLRFMQSIIFRFEGMVRQFLVDDKGTVLIAVFGVPPFSHEDDCVRGLKTALEIHHTLNDRGMDNSIGVTTGEVFCGTVGSSKRQEYAMVGDIVNLSARLMVAAGKMKAGVLCEQTTFEGAGSRLGFKELESIMVKGKSVPIKIYVPEEKDEKEQLSESIANPDEDVKVECTEIVGREQEIDMLKSSLDKLVSDKKKRIGSLTMIFGAAGIGKSHLLAYFRDIVDNVEFGYFRYFIQVVKGEADSVEKNTPFYMWRKILVELLYLDQFLGISQGGLLSTTASTDRLAKTRKEVGRDYLPYLPLLNIILPILEEPENEVTAPLSSSQRRQHLYELIKHMLSRRLSKRPLILIFDNFQWADRASLEMLYDIAKEIPELMIIVSSRPLPEPYTPVVSSMVSLPQMQQHTVGNMSIDEVSEVLKLAFKIDEVPDELQQELLKAEGNPLFSQEIFNGLIDNDAIKICGKELTICGDLSSVSIPSTVQGMVTSRIDRLPVPHQMVLKVGSVIGHEFPLSTLREVYPIEEEVNSLKYHLRSLVSEGFLVKKKSPLGAPPLKGIYLFKNDIIYKVAYNRMLFLQRQQLHRRIAEHIERNAENISAVHAILARHWRAVLDGASEPNPYALSKAVKYITATIVDMQSSNQDASQWKEVATKLLTICSDKKDREKLKKLM